MRLKLLLCLGIALAPTAWALDSDRDQPIYIQADRVFIDEKRKVSTYEGNVELTQGTLHVTASRVEVRRGEKEVDRVIATGDPVTFRQRPEGEPEDVRGQSQRVDYSASLARVELTGEAHFWRGQDEFSGQRILYESEKKVVRATGGKADDRVRAIIHPREEKKK